MAPLFQDRVAAGQELAARLARHADLHEPVVLGLPRGGVPVAAAVAAALGAPLDVLVVRKLGAPGQPELAMGAIASGGMRVLNMDVVRQLDISAATIDQVARRELVELERRERKYRGSRCALELSGRSVVLVDDGLATGATMRAAVAAVRALRPRRVVVAVPVGAPDSCRLLAEVADEVLCLHAPTAFGAVGSHYADFAQTTDDHVRRLLDQQLS